jgi:hypothetical protein
MPIHLKAGVLMTPPGSSQIPVGSIFVSDTLTAPVKARCRTDDIRYASLFGRCAKNRADQSGRSFGIE